MPTPLSPRRPFPSRGGAARQDKARGHGDADAPEGGYRRGVRGCLVSIGLGIMMVLLAVGLAAIFVSLTGTGDGAQSQAVGAQIGEPEPMTPPLNFNGFNPGNIVSTEDLHNSATMTEEQIEAFIQKWNAGCRPGPDGTPCLKDWRGEAPYFAEDDSCWEFQGGENLSAAQVIYRVSQACEMNPQALLVILQKEQGLITASGRNLQPFRYASAMGYACPDHEPCDPEFAGFSRQVYYGARQFQKYRIYPERYDYQAGVTANIPFNANPECGSQPVVIENQATASLYNYTPHQPNEQALSGRGGPCASWGNLHFYAYWRAWFTPTP